ncbi:MAG TPA: ABC transporter permease, partial [Candidatus Solibacter sp.]|nr:ABC transporter permease [Candidatus Solibacter sp.]
TQPKFPMNPFDLRDFRERNRSFEGLAGITRNDFQLSGAGEPVRLHAFRVSAGYFRVLGLTPALGREFNDRDELPNASRVVILSDRIWRTRFNSDRTILGRNILLNTVTFEVAGVMPPGVQHPGNVYHAVPDGDTVDLWAPLRFEGNPKNRGSHYVEGIARLKHGVSAEQAGAELNSIMSVLAKDYAGDKDWTIYTIPLYREMVGRSEHLLMVLLGAVGLVLLIACVNAANLLLARATARQREIAVRAALGASRQRIVRQLLTESVLIAVVGAALGAVFAAGGVRALVALLPTGFPRAAEIRLDPTVFGFTLAIAVLTGLLFGIVPALVASRTDIRGGLNAVARGSTGGYVQLRLRSLLVMGETALACVLLIGAGLMLRSFVNLLHTDPGFQPNKVLTASISLPQPQYKTKQAMQQFYTRLLSTLQEAPDVHSAGLATDLPWTGYDENLGGFLIERSNGETSDSTTGRYHVASQDFFRTMGVPLIAGRYFDDRDSGDAPKVLIINQRMAQMYWPGESAVGRRISFDDHPKDSDWFRIVGVVGDIKDEPNTLAAQPAFWWPVTQLPWQFSDMSIAVQSGASESGALAQLRTAVRTLDPGLAIADVRWMRQITGESVSGQRFALFLVGLFAALALALASIGVYGVTAYSVNQRLPEFGMRMALGARPADLMRMVLAHGVKLAAIGSVAGLLAAIGVARLLGNMLYGIGGMDLPTYVTVGVLAPLSAAIACYIPARRATNADPMITLRAE